MSIVPVNKEPLLVPADLKNGAGVFRAVNHKLRQQMLLLIHKNEQLNVTQIYTLLGLEQSVASMHLAILRKAGFVHTHRQGKAIYYAVHYARMQQANEIAGKMLAAAG